jgi:hypothetical protein
MKVAIVQLVRAPAPTLLSFQLPWPSNHAKPTPISYFVVLFSYLLSMKATGKKVKISQKQSGKE